MKVVHINQTDIYGGAALAAYRLHHQLLRDGVDSTLLVAQAGRPEPRTVAYTPPPSRLTPYVARVAQRLSLHNLQNLGCLDLVNHPAVASADVVELHSIRVPFSYAMVPRLAARKPVVWVLHDMWSFTGHCAYSFECERWKTGCGECPHPESFPAIQYDSTRIEHFLKRTLFNWKPVTIVTPSRWLADCARQSLWQHQRVVPIPNGVDLDLFHPGRRGAARTRWGIEQDKIVLLISGDNLLDPRKPILSWLQAIASELAPGLKEKLVFLVMGSDADQVAVLTGIPTIALGRVDEEETKADFYAAGDLLLFPTRADNLPLTLIESIACGTPALASAVGGVPEIIRDQETGWLVPGGDARPALDLLSRVLAGLSPARHDPTPCRAWAERHFDVRAMSRQFQDLYSHLVQEKDPARA